MSKRGRYEKPCAAKRQHLLWCIFGLAVILIIALVILFAPKPPSSTTGTQDSSNATVQKNPDSIAIPGYEILTLKADSTKQTICLPNPPQNCCYFKITLSLADGTVLWQSDFISPGEASAAITLSKPLSKGTYTGAKLTYQCFQMNEDFTPLNGAETKLTLVVK